MKLPIKLTVTLVAFSISLAGVNQPAYSKGLDDRVSEFNVLVKTGLVSVRDFYKSQNTFERHAYLLSDIRFNPSEKIGITNKKGKPTYLIRRFEEADLNARYTAIETLGAYAAGLASIAAHDAPERTEAALSSIGDSVGSIGNSFASFSGKTSSSFNYASLSGPISKIAALAGKWIVSAKKDNDLKDSIIAGEVPFSKAVSLLKRDLRNLTMSKDLAATAQLKRLTDFYNNTYLNKQVADPEISSQRLALLREIEDAAATAAVIENTDPAELLSEIDKTHKSLVNYAKSQNLSKKERREKSREARKEILTNLHLLVQEVKKITEASAELKKLSQK